MDGSSSSPVTHNVYTTGSGDGAGGGGSGGLLAMLPAMLALRGQNQDSTGAGGMASMAALPALAAVAAANGGGSMRGAHAGMGAAAGGAIGFVLGALLNGGNGGLFGNRGATTTEHFVTSTDLNTALNQQTQNQNTNAILQQLSAIAVAIPENEGKVQLAISVAQNALSNQINQSELQNAQATAMINANIAGATATVIAAESAVKDSVNAASTLSQLGIAGLGATAQQLAGGLGLQAANNLSVIQSLIRDDGDKTRALVTAFNDATLNRIITTQANEIIELKNDRTVSTNGLNISQTVNQVQAQAQAQQQQQQQFLILSNIASSLSGITQIAHATNQNVIAGNTAAVSTGVQNANPVNVA